MASLRTSSLKVMRVSQLDSDILDLELFDILKEQLWNALSLFKVSDRRPERDWLIELTFLL